MAEYKDIPTRLREATKRTDLPAGLLVLLSESYGDFVDMERKIKELYERIEALKREVDATEGINQTLTLCFEETRRARDDARREVMQWMAERSSTSEMTSEYKKRGWEYLREKTTHYFCDMCADPVHENDAYHYAKFPISIGPMNAGESGTVCRECEKQITETKNARR